ncbi:hypothetical protein [Streptomyces sp. NPDC012888]|uniref:hypothetical protein n=1 Tax=Streptomyces sp. NPDC012888 TaxID=3364855 RepID=UPI003696442E
METTTRPPSPARTRLRYRGRHGEQDGRGGRGQPGRAVQRAVHEEGRGGREGRDQGGQPAVAAVGAEVGGAGVAHQRDEVHPEGQPGGVEPVPGQLPVDLAREGLVQVDRRTQLPGHSVVAVLRQRR